MKGWIQRWIILPFFMGCKSKSAVAIASTNCPKRQLPSSPTSEDERVESSSNVKTKTSFKRGIHGLIRSFRKVSPIFSNRCEEEEEEEEEVEMEIGFPTDVKHLTHIGFDGSITTISNSYGKSEGDGRDCWDNKEVTEIVSLPSISHKQLEMAMEAQAESGCNTSTG